MEDSRGPDMTFSNSQGQCLRRVRKKYTYSGKANLSNVL